MAHLILIRPGCTDFDEQQRLQGMLDLPLNRTGEEQVRRLLEKLSGVEIDMVYTSPSEPARTTASQIGEARGIPVKEVENLHNVNVGLWQGLQLDEIRRKHPKVFKQWQETGEAICPPEGETLAEAVSRVRKALEKPLKKKNRVAIVAADPLAAIIAALLRGNLPECLATMARGTCGTWEDLGECGKQALEDAAARELAAARTT